MPEPRTPLPYLIIDFDSTFTQVEGLDELADIALTGQPNREEVVGAIRALTDRGMSGELSFSESLKQRLALLPARREHLPLLVERLKGKVSDSIRRNGDFFRQFPGRVYIVSSGFREFIEPVVADFGITADYGDETRARSVRWVHDRGKPLAGQRILITFTYTSGSPITNRALWLRTAPDWASSAIQQSAFRSLVGARPAPPKRHGAM